MSRRPRARGCHGIGGGPILTTAGPGAGRGVAQLGARLGEGEWERLREAIDTVYVGIVVGERLDDSYLPHRPGPFLEARGFGAVVLDGLEGKPSAMRSGWSTSGRTGCRACARWRPRRLGSYCAAAGYRAAGSEARCRRPCRKPLGSMRNRMQEAEVLPPKVVPPQELASGVGHLLLVRRREVTSIAADIVHGRALLVARDHKAPVRQGGNLLHRWSSEQRW